MQALHADKGILSKRKAHEQHAEHAGQGKGVSEG